MMSSRDQQSVVRHTQKGRHKAGPTFDPDKAAAYEKANYEAYYDRNWPRAFWTVVRLNREVFRMPWPAALAAAWDAALASVAFAPLDNDLPKARRYVERFYRKVRRYVPLELDTGRLAELEIDWWIVHRRLAIERQKPPHADNLEPLVESFTRLHTALFNGSPEAMRRSAEYRALACKAVDRITGRYSTDVAGDWREVEASLQQAYRAIAADAASRNGGRL